MAEQKTALAVGAHPDDVEFMMAGTLALLKQAGYQPHILTVANGSCGTAEYSQKDIIRIRAKEAANAAAVIGAQYHKGLVNDIEVYYDDATLRKVAAVVRKVKPEIVLAPSPQDYMEDHTNSCRLIVTACFIRGMRNFFTDPPLSPVMNDVYLYHANPYGHRDGMRNPIAPSLFVDVASVMDVKDKMLRCHLSQKNWLDVSQGMDSYIVTMKNLCQEAAKMSGVKGLKYAEGFRQHMHLGFSAQDRDMLKEVLGKKVVARKR